jgi:hypothetical protein
VLLWCEQGLGDAIQFIRYAPLVKASGGRIVLECPSFMAPLFSSCPGVDELAAEEAALPEFDVQVPLMSLPRLLGTTLATVPADVPYLHAEVGRVEKWKARLEGMNGFKVGVVWQGNPRQPWDRWRSFPLTSLAPLAAVERGAAGQPSKGARGRTASGAGRVDDDDMAIDHAVEEFSQSRQAKFFGQHGQGQGLEILTDVAGGDANKLQTAAFGPSQKLADGVEIVFPRVMVRNLALEEFLPGELRRSAGEPHDFRGLAG